MPFLTPSLIFRPPPPPPPAAIDLFNGSASDSIFRDSEGDVDLSPPRAVHIRVYTCILLLCTWETSLSHSKCIIIPYNWRTSILRFPLKKKKSSLTDEWHKRGQVHLHWRWLRAVFRSQYKSIEKSTSIEQPCGSFREKPFLSLAIVRTDEIGDDCASSRLLSFVVLRCIHTLTCMQELNAIWRKCVNRSTIDPWVLCKSDLPIWWLRRGSHSSGTSWTLMNESRYQRRRVARSRLD